MRKSRFTKSQIVAFSRQEESGVPIPEVTRQAEISRVTLLPLEAALRGRDGRGTAAAEGAGCRKCSVQAALRRDGPAERTHQGRAEPKPVRRGRSRRPWSRSTV